MKIEVVFLLMLACGTYAQIIEIKEGEAARQVYNFTCDEPGTIDTTGINRDFFSTNTSGETTFVFLQKKIDLKNENDFPVISGSECLKQVNLSDRSIRLKCKGNTLSSHVLIIKPKNEYKPFICDTSCNNFSNPLNLDIPENTTVNAVIKNFRLCSTDMNVDTNSLSISISGLLGESNKKNIILKEKLDYENQTDNVNSRVSVNGTHVLDIRINIEDSDDLGIEFNKTFYECQVAENKKGPVTASNCLVNAKDLDKGINAEVKYSLISVSPDVATFILSQDGSLTLNASLDREQTPVYHLFIKGFQADRPHDRVDYTTMQVTVTDVNDNHPIMNKTQYTVQIMENSPIGTLVCQVSATDRDVGQNAENEFYLDVVNKFFEVEKKTGFVKVKSLIDRESIKNNLISFQIYAASVTNNTIRSNSSSIDVLILDENDNSPKFTNTHRTIYIDKTQKLQVPITRVTATDPDDGVNGTIVYSIMNSNIPFRLDSKSGALNLTQSLNESFSPLYQLNINATDQSANVNNRRSSLMVMTINVSDVNIHSPKFFQNMTKSVNISEDAQIGTILMELKAADVDPTDYLTFSLQGDGGGKFGIKNNAFLMTKDKLDRESKGSYQLTISVNDSTHVTKTTVDIEVTDVNDNTPTFEQTQYNFTVKEEMNNAQVGVIKANDKDSGQNKIITYKIDTYSKWNNNFTINSTTGTISTKQRIDKERMQNDELVSFFVFAYDGGKPRLRIQTLVTVEVQDINDNGPAFGDDVVKLHLKEHIKHVNFYQAKAIDVDTGSNGEVRYALKGQMNGLITVSQDGNVSLNKKLEFNDITGSKPCGHTRCVQFTIEAYNPANYETNYMGQSAGNDTQVVNITIEDVNEKPYFKDVNKTTYIKIIEEIPKEVWKMYPSLKNLNFIAVDDDLQNTSYSTVLYTFYDPSGKFTFDNTTGRIYQQKRIDYDPPSNETEFTLLLKASNPVALENGKESSNTVAIYISIEDKDDNLPKFTKDLIVCNVPEDKPIGQVDSCFVRAIDKDTDAYNKFSYRISKGNEANVFDISRNGSLGLKKGLDYEKSPRIYNITVSAVSVTYITRQCGGSSSSKPRCSANCSITLNVINVNDEPPEFKNKSYKFSIAESNKTGLVVGHISAFDKDGDINDLKYSLISKTGSVFRVDEYGFISTTTTVDYEQQSVYTLTATVNDSKHEAYANVSVHILPVNEYPPVFSSNYSWTIKEDVTLVKHINATDKDKGDNKPITYGANLQTRWTKTNNISIDRNTGNITLRTIDREALGNDEIIQFTVLAVDGGTPPRTGIATISVKILGVNDNCPSFLAETKHITLDRKEGKTYPNIFTSQAVDADIGNGSKISYRLAKGKPLFHIDKDTGVISTKEKLLINSSNNGILKIEVEAYNDGAVCNATQYISVILQDINNNCPMFNRSTFLLNVSECTAPGGLLTQISANDADTSVKFNTVTYWIENNYTNTFNIDSKSGKIYLEKRVDFDPPNSQGSFQLTVYATDDLVNRNRHSNHTSNMNISISIIGCNDNAPVFDQDHYNCTIQENRNGTFNCVLRAHDTDGDNIKYALISGKQTQTFKVAPKSGNISVIEPFDFDTMASKDIILNVSASDGNHTSFTSVVVQVIDENDIRPKFIGAPYNFSVREGTPTERYIIGSVNVTDADSKSVTLAIVNCADILEVLNNRNVVALKQFDYEVKQKYSCRIRANDTLSANVTAVMTVNVIDVNDNAPVFNRSLYNQSINETIKIGTSVCKVLAHDKDISTSYNKIVYTIFSGNNQGLLTINNTSGEIRTAKVLKHNGGQTLALVIKATDNGKPPLVGYTNVSIEIKRENINRPEFLNIPYKATVHENRQNISVLKVIAEDEDGDLSHLTFTVVNATNSFYFNKTVLYTFGLDAEQTTGIVYVNISVSDGIFSDTTIVAVNVIDENDNNPYFEANTCNTTVRDTTNPDTMICQITAADKDISNKGFTYILSEGKGDFRINRTSGQIFLTNRFGRNGQLYNMSVTVADSGVPPKYNTTAIRIVVKDTNQPIKFKNETLMLQFNENNASVNALLTVNQTRLNRHIKYSVISDNRISILKTFNLNTTTALLTLANESNCLDFEEKSKYIFTISAEDQGVFPKTSSAVVIVNVVDENEPPKITKYDQRVLKEENTTTGAFISMVEVSDPDSKPAFNSLKFTLSEDKNFKVNERGNITVRAAHLKADNYSLTITVTDGGNLTDNKTTLVIVPEVHLTPITHEVKENSSKPIIISSFPTHQDGLEVVYTLAPSLYSGYFKMHQNGSLILFKPLDREVTDSVHIRVLGKETTQGIMVADIKVNLTIQDENDCPPEFLKSKYTVTIPDVTVGGTVIATVGVVDRDIDKKNRNLSFNTTNGQFSLDNMGNLRLKDSTTLSTGNLSFTISVTDGKFTSRALVSVNVTDTNNHSPKFGNSTYSFNIIETNNTNVTVGTLSAHDDDNGENGVVTFSLQREYDDLPFRVSNLKNNSCIIETVNPIDREIQATYNFMITATDNGTHPRQSVCRVFVNVQDVNDNFPKFEGASSFSGSVLENATNNTPITLPAITVTDPDSGLNGEAGLVYRLNASKVPICIEREKPSLYVCGKIDRENKSIYYLTIIAQDSNGTEDSLSTSAPLTIHILDVNDEPPQFTNNLYQFDVSENVNTSESVGVVSATDTDEGGNIKYKIVSGDDRRFYINPITGTIFVGGNIDREAKPRYSLNISASDGPHKVYTSVNITITDKNDNPPKFLMSTFEEAVIVEVEEDNQAGVIFNATAVDLDEPGSSRSTVIYSLSVSPSGAESNLFEIEEDGGLFISRTLDREMEDHYEVNITATDQGTPPLSTSLLVHVKVLDVNDNHPEICVDGKCNVNTSECYTVEKVPKYSVLKLIGSSDMDEGQNGTVTFSIEQSEFSKYFKIDNSTGVVAVAEPLVVNNLIHEGVAQVSNETVVVNLTIVATDGGGLNSTLTLHVFVEPLNDDDVPLFSESVFRFNISETNNIDVPVGNCSATTNDTNSHMTYELISSYDGHLAAFEIDQSTGVLKTTLPLDRETVDMYTFAVQVRDGRVPERTAFAAIEVTVDDINDNVPTFEKDSVTITVHENATIFIQQNVTAHDNDAGINAEIMYTLDNATKEYGGLFNLSKGILTVTGIFDYEEQSKYDIVVTATDKGVTPLSSAAEVHILVIDENDNSPEFVNENQVYNISEDKTSGKIFTANATDADSGWNGQIVYKLLNMEEVPFVIDPFNGSVYLQGKLDYEVRNNYTLSIVAEDLGSPPQSTTQSVTIYVEDVYDYELMFLKDTYDIYVSRSAPMNSSLLNLTVGVPEPSFSLKGQEIDNFRIGQKSGELILAKHLNTERELYVVHVIAEDGHGQNTSCTVIVHVTGHQVTFNTSELKLSLMENLNGTSVLVDLNTTAELLGKGVVYTIVEVRPSGKDSFKVNSSTGVVFCTKALNREENAQYTILISANTPDARKKREVQRPSPTIRLVLDVGDVNDNPPHFTSDQERIFGVPEDVRANFVVGTIKAEDPDTSDIGHLRYTAVGGRTDVFGIDRETGEIKTLVAIASTRKRQFHLLINASDGNIIHENATLNVTIYVVPTKNQPVLLLNMTVAEFKKREEGFRRNMSEILGVNIQFDKIESHQIESNGRTHVDLSRTDLIFHGINKSSGLLVPNRKLKELITNAMEKLSTLFGQKIEVNVVFIDIIADPSAITATQVLLICMAVFIFFGSLAALIVAQYSWMRYETERQAEEKEAERIEHEMELSTIRSRQSSKLSSIMASAAVNPAFVDTEFITSNGQLSPKMTTEPQYESQELKVNFDEEPLEAYLNGPNPRNNVQSVIDSGVGNTSIHSEDNHLESSDTEANENRQANLQVNDGLPVNGEGPVMTSSPRVSRDVRPAGNELSFKGIPEDQNDQNDSRNGMDLSQGRRNRASSVLLLDATGESETDDTVDGNANEIGYGEDESREDTIVSETREENAGKVSDQPVETLVTTGANDDDGSSEGGTSAVGNEPNDGESIHEDKDDTDVECTSF